MAATPECTTFRDNYNVYRDRIAGPLLDILDRHRSTCPHCAAFDRALDAGVTLLRQARITTSPAFLERLFHRLGGAAGPSC